MPSNTENISFTVDTEGCDGLEAKKHIIEARQRKVLANLGRMVKEIGGDDTQKSFRRR